jgi:DNA-binding MarR family transcriptional regulator
MTVSPSSAGPAGPASPAGLATPADNAAAELAAQAWQGMRAPVLDRYDRRKTVRDALGMSFIRAKALRRIVDGPMTMRELAAALGTDPPYTTVVVDDLERRGLVNRTVRAGDRRSKIVSITPDGAGQAQLAERILNDPPRPVRELPPADLEVLTGILGTLLDTGA